MCPVSKPLEGFRATLADDSPARDDGASAKVSVYSEDSSLEMGLASGACRTGALLGPRDSVAIAGAR